MIRTFRISVMGVPLRAICAFNFFKKLKNSENLFIVYDSISEADNKAYNVIPNS